MKGNACSARSETTETVVLLYRVCMEGLRMVANPGLQLPSLMWRLDSNETAYVDNIATSHD